MGWDADDTALLKQLWAKCQSAAQIARRLGCSRNAVCGMLTRLGLKRVGLLSRRRGARPDVDQRRTRRAAASASADGRLPNELQDQVLRVALIFISTEVAYCSLSRMARC